jgi:peptidyl-tRNA hydrolase, PTH2 family
MCRGCVQSLATAGRRRGKTTTSATMSTYSGHQALLLSLSVHVCLSVSLSLSLSARACLCVCCIICTPRMATRYRKLAPEQQQHFINVPVSTSMEGYSDDEETESDTDGEDMEEPVKMMLCVNQEVYRDGKKTKMKPGKVAAQCGHACLGCYLVAERCPEASRQGEALRRWSTQGQMKITLKIPSVDMMMELKESARAAGIPHCLIRDAGHTQIDPGTKTVLALGPALASELAPITVRSVAATRQQANSGPPTAQRSSAFTLF